MARIGIITCANCTQNTHCASVVCLGDMRKRRGFFEKYPKEESLDLIGMITCAGCPTLAAPEKILPRVEAIAAYKADALHFSYCMTALCPFINQYTAVVAKAFPNLDLVMGTHRPIDKGEFRRGVKELLCQELTRPQTMNHMVDGSLKVPGGPLQFV
ncbi:MAG: CGGC domain-containing protein [Desulfobacterales bacterium]|nr:CGGC domain-containing protein [Desulfobacterales bacterium]